MTKKTKKITKSTILSLLVTTSIYTGAVLIYFYANGWRIDPKQDDLIVKTGSVSIESTPISSNITIDNKESGKTPKSLNLNIGEHTVSISNKGYSTWKKDIVVKEEKLTPLNSWLIPLEKKETEIFLQEGENIIEYWIDEDQNRLIFLTKTIEKEVDDTLENTETLEDSYTLWAYDINRVFWDLSDNPYELFSFTASDLSLFNVDLSHSGTSALVKIQKDESPIVNHIITTTRPTTYKDLDILDIAELEKYEMTWSLDDQFLIFESDTELITYNIDKDTKHLIFKKSEDRKYVWTTDLNGYFYQIIPVETEENLYQYSLNRKDLDGANSNTLLSELYFQKDNQYIEKYRKDRKDLVECACNSFTNSPESTQTVGEIYSLDINQEAQGMFIETSEASYWYSFDNKKWLLVNPYPSQILEYSENKDMFTYNNEQGTHIFTFKKDIADHTSTIGSRKLSVLDEATDIKWLSNDYIMFSKNNSAFTIDKEGDNQTEMLRDLDIITTYTMQSSLESLITLDKIEVLQEEDDSIQENGFIIKSYSLK